MNKYQRELQELLTIKLELNAKSMASSQILTTYCKPYRGAMGLISDDCTQSEQYKKLKWQFETDWLNLRAFNKRTSKNKDLQEAIKEIRKGKERKRNENI